MEEYINKYKNLVNDAQTKNELTTRHMSEQLDEEIKHVLQIIDKHNSDYKCRYAHRNLECLNIVKEILKSKGYEVYISSNINRNEQYQSYTIRVYWDELTPKILNDPEYKSDMQNDPYDTNNKRCFECDKFHKKVSLCETCGNPCCYSAVRTYCSNTCRDLLLRN